MTIAEQMDLLELLEEQKLAAPASSLYASSARGVRARAEEFEAWQSEHGSFGCYGRSHAWHLELRLSHHEDVLTDRCQPTVLQADLRCQDNAHSRPCQCVGDLVSRGACLGCDWEGPVQGTVALAVADAHDHAWSGWRDLPVVSQAAGARDIEEAARGAPDMAVSGGVEVSGRLADRRRTDRHPASAVLRPGGPRRHWTRRLRPRRS
jgi:hypothetical protein